jgi:AraC family transcriptional regulator, regulatory protein of adaptative response / methylated-DNA-[protein]-cysteine methyltransferase
MQPRIGQGYVRYRGGDGDLHISEASYGPGGQGARIQYSAVATPFGMILIAATARGICWLGIHESEAYLESGLRGDYPKAHLDRDDVGICDYARRLLAFVAGETAELELPLDIRATPFESAVWRQLCEIPPGATRSYGEIARRIGRPGAARAVGRANGRNPVAIIIPCHRVIGSSGALTGYRWGVEYKRRLLEKERALAQPYPPLRSKCRDEPNRPASNSLCSKERPTCPGLAPPSG